MRLPASQTALRKRTKKLDQECHLATWQESLPDIVRFGRKMDCLQRFAQGVQAYLPFPRSVHRRSSCLLPHALKLTSLGPIDNESIEPCWRDPADSYWSR